ncbi:hypothetical protein PHISP_04329 [Aspergillus sp. HF37]|nr:hypothetical protein PHISP_04329 [Aspergillus sp. HF37]
MSMSRRSSSSSSSSSPPKNEVFAYPFSSMQRNCQSHTQTPQGPVEGPGGRRLVRRVTWRSSSHRIVASLWVLGMVYIAWLIRYLVSSPSPSPSPSSGPAASSPSVGAGG